MFGRIVLRSLTRGMGSKLLAVLTIAVATMLAAAMLNMALGVGDQVNRELKSYGANIMVEPLLDSLPLELTGMTGDLLAGDRYLDEADIPTIKMIFWRNNILGLAPYLEVQGRVGQGQEVTVIGTYFDHQLSLVTGETFRTGVASVKPYWEVNGRWVQEGPLPEVMVGQELADQLSLVPGNELEVELATSSGPFLRRFPVVGIIQGTDQDNSQVYLPLNHLQQLVGLPGKVSRVAVSALTSPEDQLSRLTAGNPEYLNADDYETWYCTAYADSIAFQIEEAIPGVKAKPVRQITQAEGRMLNKVQFLMAVLTLAALISAGLGLSNLMTTQVLERSREIGLLHALGAGTGGVVVLFLTEVVVLGILGGLAGYVLGLGLATTVARLVFGGDLGLQPLLLPLVLLVAVFVAVGGSLSAVRILSRLQPAVVLRGQ